MWQASTSFRYEQPVLFAKWLWRDVAFDCVVINLKWLWPYQTLQKHPQEDESGHRVLLQVVDQRPALSGVNMAQFQHSVATFLLYCQFELNLSPHTLKAYRLDLDHFNAFLRGTGHSREVGEINRALIKDYLQKLSQFKPRTQRRRMAALKSCFGYLEREGLNAENPLMNLRLNIRIGRALPRTVSLSTLDGLFSKLHA